MTFRHRITLVATAAVAIAVLIASALTYVLVSDQLHRQVDNSLRDTALGVQRGVAALRRGGGTISLVLPPGVAPGQLRRIFELRYHHASPRRDRGLGRLLFATPRGTLGQDRGVVQLLGVGASVLIAPDEGPTRLPVDARARKLAESGGPSYFSDINLGSDHLRVLTAALPAGTSARAIQIARSLNEVDHTLSNLRLLLVLVALGGIAFAALLGALVSRAAIGPVRRLTQTAEHVAVTQDLTRRIDGRGGGELSRLAASFNAMLDALERSMGALDESVRAQRRLVADASHELRTPVTALRANIEVLQQSPSLPASERERLLDDVVEQLHHLTLLINDVIELARGDEPLPAREEVRFDQIVVEVIERARLHAPATAIKAALEPALVFGDPARLDRAVSNLLDNALKFGPREGPVEVTLRAGSVQDGSAHDGAAQGGAVSCCELTVRDHGPGIARAELAHVFDRFYRGSGARAVPGSGLGLAIVRQVAQTHGGSVSAHQAPDGGTLMRLRLPQLGACLVDGDEADLEDVAGAAQV